MQRINIMKETIRTYMFISQWNVFFRTQQTLLLSDSEIIPDNFKLGTYSLLLLKRG
jgi:hypothetical protein